MPAQLDDPETPTIYRTSGSAPFPDPHDPDPSLPLDVKPCQMTLRDRVTIATLVPFSSRHQVPHLLMAYLCDQLNREIEGGDTYPMTDPMSIDKFGAYWFQNFGAVMLLGHIERVEDVFEGQNWANVCLGSFYIKPNYPGRSSHVCNAGFLVTDAARNRGVGRLMGETYIDWAPKLGYTYSVFNLVYETNVASCRIWDALGFKRIGRVKGCGALKSYPDRLIDAIIYGRDLGPEDEEFVSEDRFDKIKFYLKYGNYPSGADRAEKSRLRSAATHYKLLDNDKLMLKDKEVISDTHQQYEIARKIHIIQHGGINKTTASIAENYHWVRIKETVSLVIRNCAKCKEMAKTPTVRVEGVTVRRSLGIPIGQNSVSAPGRILSLRSQLHHEESEATPETYDDPFQRNSANSLNTTSVSPQAFDQSLNSPMHGAVSETDRSRHHRAPHHSTTIAQLQHHVPDVDPDEYMPLDPQIMEDVHGLGTYNSHDHDLHNQHDDAFHTMLTGHHANETSVRHHDVDNGMVVGHSDGDLDMLIEDDEEVPEHAFDVGVGVSDSKDTVQSEARAPEAVMTSQHDLGLFGHPYQNG